jgi:MFS family permease
MNNFVWKMSLYRFLDAVKLVGVIFVLLFAHNGMTPFQISILISIWSITSLLLEVPLGTVADKYPRRNLLIIALLVHVVGFILWLKGGFIFYALGFVLWGIKNALVSGTQEAFVFDELKVHGKELLYEKVNGKLESAFWTGITVSAVLGGLVASINYNLVIVFSIITTLLAIVALLTIKSVKPIRSTGEAKYLDVLKEAITEIKTNSTLWGIIAFFCLIFATYGAADEYWALIYQALGLPVAIVGVLVAIGYGFFTLAGWTLHLFDNDKIRGKEHYLLLGSAIIFILAGLLKSFISIPLIFLAMYIFKIAHLKFDAKFQYTIKSDQRATVSSLKSLIFEFVYMGFVLMFGLTSEKIGITSLMYILGILLLVWLVVFKIFLPVSLNKILAVKNTSTTE